MILKKCSGRWLQLSASFWNGTLLDLCAGFSCWFVAAIQCLVNWSPAVLITATAAAAARDPACCHRTFAIRRSWLSAPTRTGVPEPWTRQTGSWMWAREVGCKRRRVSLGSMGRGWMLGGQFAVPWECWEVWRESIWLSELRWLPAGSQVKPEWFCCWDGAGPFWGRLEGMSAGHWGYAQSPWGPGETWVQSSVWPRGRTAVSSGEICVCWTQLGSPCAGEACCWDLGGAGSPCTDSSLTVAAWAMVTFVLSLKLVKSWVLVIAKMCASPVFILNYENSHGVLGLRFRGLGQ